MIVFAIIRSYYKKVIAFYAEEDESEKLRLIFQISLNKNKVDNVIVGYKKEYYISFDLERIKRVNTINDVIRYLNGKLRLGRTIYFSGRNTECLELFERILSIYGNKDKITHEDILNTRYFILASN